MSSMAVQYGGVDVPVPASNQRLTGGNPLLPQMPASGEVDSQYLAEEAQLRAQVAKNYADILQQIGYNDPATGQFIPGSISINAGRQNADLQRQSDLAAEDVTNQAQQAGTLFSGRRAYDTARAQYPYQTQMARLGVDVPIQIGGLYEQAAGLIDQYTLQNNLYLAALAQRRAAAIAAQPAGRPPVQPPQDTGGGGDGGGGDGGYAPEETGGLTEPIPPPTSGTDIGYFGGGAGGFTGSTTPPAVVQPANPRSSNNSPYYYGGGGGRPRR